MLKNIKNLNNNKGAALIVGYIVMFALVALSSSVAMFNFNEMGFAKRYRDMTAAFWLAEAGIQDFLHNSSMLDENPTKVYELGRGTVYITKDDSDVTKRVVTASGIVGEIKRSIRVEYPAAPGVFDQTFSVIGDFKVSGKKSTLLINDKVRLSGEVINKSKHSSVFFEDLRERLNPGALSLSYPDTDGNGKSDEFRDFVLFNQQLLQNYSEDEVVYLKGNGQFTITPSKKLANKKIIYIEGDEGKSNVSVQFSGAWPQGQNVTIITTGHITNNLAGNTKKDTQLNIIAWSGYKETSILPSSYKGVVFTHGKAVFDDVHDASITNGSVIAKDGVEIREVWSAKTFNYTDTRTKGKVPPGFEGLIGGSISNYTAKPNLWREVMI